MASELGFDAIAERGILDALRLDCMAIVPFDNSAGFEARVAAYREQHSEFRDELAAWPVASTTSSLDRTPLGSPADPPVGAASNHSPEVGRSGTTPTMLGTTSRR
jgi:hypothetical protein